MNQKKILFILPSLKAGGAERVMSFISKSLDTDKYHSTLLIIGHQKDAVYQYIPALTIFLNKDRVLLGLFDVIKFILKNKPSIVISSIGHINILMGLFSLFLPKTKFIARLASVTSYMDSFSSGNSNWFIEKLSNIAYTRFNKIICQSQDMLDDFNLNYGISKKSMVIINNPVTFIPSKIRKDGIKLKKVKFITVGRLSEEKGHFRILQSLSKINTYDFKYTIIGQGPLEKEIIDLVNILGLSEKVEYIQYTSDVNKHLIEHDVFLQGSYVEGFPNATLESCAAGVPALAFNAPGGTKEIISSGVNGYIAENQKEFELYLINIEVLLKLKATIVSTYTLNRFSSERIIEQYENVFFND